MLTTVNKPLIAAAFSIQHFVNLQHSITRITGNSEPLHMQNPSSTFKHPGIDPLTILKQMKTCSPVLSVPAAKSAILFISKARELTTTDASLNLPSRLPSDRFLQLHKTPMIMSQFK